jgi:hypothetical protein
MSNEDKLAITGLTKAAGIAAIIYITLMLLAAFML